MESPEAIHRPCESALPSWGRSDSRCQMEPRRGSIWQRSDLGSLGRCQGGGLLYRRWKVDGEGCAFVGAAFDLEHAAVAIDDVLDDRESQAGAAEAARDRKSTRLNSSH